VIDDLTCRACRVAVCLAIVALQLFAARADPQLPVPRQGEVDAPSSKLQMVFDPDTLGAQVAYLEKMIGPAWKVWGPERIYKVDGCVVAVTVKDSAVRSLHLPISPKCQFDINPFYSRRPEFPNLVGMTFGDFDKRGGSGFFSASCLSMCGNAVDPVVQEYLQGSHAGNWIDVILEVGLVGRVALDASTAWESMMQRSVGENYVLDTKFNCDHKFDQAAHKLFSEVPITGITVGFNLSELLEGKCSSLFHG
jgi:hypothetical protein